MYKKVYDLVTMYVGRTASHFWGLSFCLEDYESYALFLIYFARLLKELKLNPKKSEWGPKKLILGQEGKLIKKN